MKKFFKIIYEDTDIIVIDKSAQVLTIQDRFDPTRPNLKSLLRKKYDSIFVVHRLDLQTTGLIVFSKNERAHKHLSVQFENRSVEKIYHTICQHPSEESGSIETGLTEHPNKKGTYQASQKGKHAHTKYRVIASYDRYALVEVNILTGRTHQIRVHMKHIGAPLLTDSKYGISDAFFLSQIKRIHVKKDAEERPLLSRTALHSYQLSIDHPSTNERMTFTAQLPKDMKAVIYQLGKVGKSRW